MNFLGKLTANLPFYKKPASAEYFFAVIIGLSEVTAAVWEILDRDLDLLSQKTLPYHNTDDLLDKTYQALDRAVEVLEVEPKKVLFGVPDLWSVDDNLKEPYLKLLQRLLKECDLEPLAYVTTTNAISFSLQKQEGVPSTAILLGVGDFVEATLVRGGKIAGTRTTARSEHLFNDIEKILNQFTEAEVLPSKILLYSTKKGLDLGKIRDGLMSYPWMSKLSFLHFPKIDILDEATTTKSVILAGAFEMYPEVNFKHGFLQKQLLEEKEQTYTKNFSREEATGFVKGDIKEKMQSKTESAEEQKKDPSSEVGGEVEKPEHERVKFGQHLIRVKRPLAEDLEEEIVIEKPLSKILKMMKNIIPPSITTQVKKMFHNLPRIKLARLNSKILILPVLFLVLILAYVLLVKADVTIFVEPKTLEESAEIVADPKAEVISEESKVIPGKIVEITVSGKMVETASGTKQIGDPARGKVVIYNKTDSSRTFSQGTILTSSNNLKFILDSSVVVASQSAVEGGISFGKATMSATAVAVGPDSNLPGGTQLTISQQSADSFSAKVDEAFSGGTSQTVTVVTSDDHKKLKAKVLDELKQKAEGELQGKMAEGQKIVSDVLVAADGKYNFSKEVGDQAKDFSLSATVGFRGTSYFDSDLSTIISKLVKIEVPEGYEMNLQNAETQSDIIKTDKDGRVTFMAKFRAKLLPKFNSDDLKKQIRGKSVEGAAVQLKSLESVIGSEVRLTPPLPAKISRLPIWDRNISINITPK